jgi:hypothetical protein
MTIERLHSEDGFPISFKGPVEQELANIVLENADLVETLSQGEYNLTPSHWQKHLYIHSLTVLEDGTGVYRAIPREEGVGTRELSRNGWERFQEGERMIRIPQDGPLVVVSGPLKDKKTIGIHEIIFYSPSHKD